MMKRRQFVSLMAGISLAMAFALTGCDDVLAKIQKGQGGAADTAFPTFTEVVTQMEIDAEAGSESATYTLDGYGFEDSYLADLTLTPGETCPATVTINGGPGGWVVTGTGMNSITVESGVSLTLQNITFETLPFTVDAGGTLVLETDAVVTGNAGTGVTVSGTLEMSDGSSVTQNGDSGVRIDGTDGVFTMRGGTISDNTVPVITGADIGGAGVAMWGANSKFTMSDGTISGNTVPIITGAEDTGGGGGIAMYGTNSKFTMSGGTISGNSAMWGGGVELYGGRAVFTMEDGTISDNNSSNDGGGVDVDGESATFAMSGGVIKDNKAKYNGGGVYVYNTTFNMTGGEIKDNDAGGWGGAPGIGGVVAPTIGGNPWIGADKASGTGPGWIHGNTALDVNP